MAKERNKDIQIGKGEVKISLFMDDMILYIQNPKQTKIKLLEWINSCIRHLGYKSKIQKNCIFYTSNWQSEKEIKKTIPFYSVIKTNKILRNKLTKRTARLFIVRRLNISKMAMLPKSIYRYNVIHIKISADFLQKLTSWSENSYGTRRDPK